MPHNDAAENDPAGSEQKTRPAVGQATRDLGAMSREELLRLVTELQGSLAAQASQTAALDRAKQHLERYRDRYLDLYDFAPVGYLTLDEDAYVQEINLAGAEMLGADRDAVIGYPLLNYVAETDRPALGEHVRRCIERHEKTTTEVTLTTATGRVLLVQLQSVPTEDEQHDGLVLCKTAITDLTQRRVMEEAMRRSQAFLQSVVDAIPDVTLVIDRNYDVLLANEAARRRAGNKDPVSACLKCYQLSHHRDAPCKGDVEQCPLRAVIATKQPVRVEHLHYDAEGNDVYVEISATPIFDQDGEVVQILEASRDITPRKRAESSLARASSGFGR